MLWREYRGKPLDEASVDRDPAKQFQKWLHDAVKARVSDPHAFTLSTATPDGRPSGRIVLLKGFTDDGFVFYTNYGSRKGRELVANPHASATFFWPELERQVRIEGTVKKASAEMSDKYFASRPRGAQIATYISQQSDVIESRKVLEELFRDAQKKFKGVKIPRPENWGGFILKPRLYEFWQGRINRLHDRILYEQCKDGRWCIMRLAP